MRVVKTCRRLGSNRASPNGSQQNCGLERTLSCSIWPQWTPGLAGNGKINGVFIGTTSENCLNTWRPSSGKNGSSEMLLVLQEGLSQALLSFWKKWCFWPCCLWSNHTFIAEIKARSWIINKILVAFPVALRPLAVLLESGRIVCHSCSLAQLKKCLFWPLSCGSSNPLVPYRLLHASIRAPFCKQLLSIYPL